MRIEQLTFTRFLAAISIVVYHYGLNISPFNNESFSFLFKSANLGVGYFFILSGFVMMIAYNGKKSINTLEFYKNRFARIYPAYLLAILLILFYDKIALLRVDYEGLKLNLLGIQAWFPGKALSINYPGWSLSVEFFFYAIFPFLFNYVYTNSKYIKGGIIVIILIWIASQILLRWFVSSEYYKGVSTESFEFIYFFPLMHLNQFLVGTLAGIVFIKKLQGKQKNYDWVIIIILLAIFLTLKYSTYNLQNGLFAILFIPLIIMTALNSGKITSFFKIKPFVFLGEISFGIYIFQYPINLLSNLVLDKMAISDATLRFYIYFFSLILFSAISYILIETPFRKQMKKVRFSKKKALISPIE